jgi:hypothetical protein
MTVRTSSRHSCEAQDLSIPATLPFTQTESKVPAKRSDEKIGLRILGDGPIATGAAEDAAEADEEDLDMEVSPGRKGWLNLVGVSHVISVIVQS